MSLANAFANRCLSYAFTNAFANAFAKTSWESLSLCQFPKSLEGVALLLVVLMQNQQLPFTQSRSWQVGVLLIPLLSLSLSFFYLLP